MTGFKVLFRINIAVDDPISSLPSIPANPSGPFEQVFYRPSPHLYHMLVIGGHVISYAVKQRLIAASDVEGNAFMLVIYFHRLVVKLNPHLTAHVLVWNRVIM